MSGPARRPEIHRVDAARLAFGRWDTEQNVQAGEGDIVGSYSADRIGMGQPLRRPFKFRNGLWVCTGITGRSGQTIAEAYRLTDPTVFEGRPTNYPEKTRDRWSSFGAATRRRTCSPVSETPVAETAESIPARAPTPKLTTRPGTWDCLGLGRSCLQPGPDFRPSPRSAPRTDSISDPPCAIDPLSEPPNPQSRSMPGWPKAGIVDPDPAS